MSWLQQRIWDNDVERGRIATPRDKRFERTIKFEPRDLWVGVYWDHQPYIWNPDGTEHTVFDLYVCLIPCFPLHLSWRC